MINRLFLIGTIIVLVLGVIGTAYILGSSEEASEPLEAIPINEVQGETAVSALASDSLLFEINQEQSQVSFNLDEDLRGVRTTVLGTTNQVAGQIALNTNDLSTVQVGIIQVNARTFATDNDMRNRAIQNRILETGSYEYITFTPTAITGLPNSANINEILSFSIIGNLTIRDITQQASFDVTAMLVSETELSGTAITTIAREEYNLNIPSVPSVANVDDAVTLTIEFVAEAK